MNGVGSPEAVSGRFNPWQCLFGLCSLLLQVFAEPADHLADKVYLLRGAGKRWAMLPAGNPDNPGGDTHPLQSRSHRLSLYKGHARVGISMNHQKGRVVGGDMVDGRGFPVGLDSVDVFEAVLASLMPKNDAIAALSLGCDVSAFVLCCRKDVDHHVRSAWLLALGGSSMTLRKLLAVLLLSGWGATLFGQELAPSRVEFFEARIRPVLAKNCFACHTETHLGGLRVDSREGLLRGGNSGPAIEPGNVAGSLLIRAVSHTMERLKMPLGGSLTAREIADLKTWVQEGAFWPETVVSPASVSATGKYVIRPEQKEFWSFQPIAKPPIPAVKEGRWIKTPIDSFIGAKLEEQGLKPAGPADKRTLIRRATFDLLGLPPTPAEVEAFLADDSPQAFARVIDRLLASPHYGERWGRYWLDLARYADDPESREDLILLDANAFRYRDWVIKAFNDDLPYDTFVKAQLAADLMPESERPKLLPALGFHALGRKEEDDRVDVTTQTFLALTVACAKCHDHKFDPVPTADFYSLQGVFKSSELQEYPLVSDEEVHAYKEITRQMKEKEEEIYKFVQVQKAVLADILLAQTSQYMMAAWDVMKGHNTSELAASGAGLDLRTLNRWIKYLRKNERDHTYLRAWDSMMARNGTRQEAQLLADGFQRAVLAVVLENKQIEERNYIKLGGSEGAKDRKVKDTTNIEFLEIEKRYLWRDMVDDPCKTNGCQCGLLFEGGIVFYGDKGDEHHGFFQLAEEDKIDRFLQGEWKRHLARLRAELAGLKKALPPRYPLLHGYRDSDHPQDVHIAIRGDENSPGEIAPRQFLQILSQGAPKPLTKGSGRLELAEAIASPENPLTARVMVNRIWQHHFGQGIVRTPSNFGQLGERPTHPLLLDYLARQFIENGWSLKAIHREIMLSATYQWSTSYIADNYERDPDNRLLWRANFTHRLDAEALRDAILSVAGSLDPTVGGPARQLTEGHRRRTLYSVISRGDLDRTLVLFDFPDPNGVSAQRTVTAGPLQQLYFLNGEFVMTQAKVLAERLQSESGNDDLAKIGRVYQLLYARPPAQAEIEIGLAFLAKSHSGWPQYLQALLASGEFGSVN